MLVLGRRVDEKIIVGNITITVVRIQGGEVRLGIDAPPEVSIHREEVLRAIERQEREGEG